MSEKSKYEVKTSKWGDGFIDTVKIGNVEFVITDFKPKTKAEFVKKYENKVHKFNRDDAWDFLKQFVPKDVK